MITVENKSINRLQDYRNKLRVMSVTSFIVQYLERQRNAIDVSANFETPCRVYDLEFIESMERDAKEFVMNRQKFVCYYYLSIYIYISYHQLMHD